MRSSGRRSGREEGEGRAGAGRGRGQKSLPASQPASQRGPSPPVRQSACSLARIGGRQSRWHPGLYGTSAGGCACRRAGRARRQSARRRGLWGAGSGCKSRPPPGRHLGPHRAPGEWWGGGGGGREFEKKGQQIIRTDQWPVDNERPLEKHMHAHLDPDQAGQSSAGAAGPPHSGCRTPHMATPFADRSLDLAGPSLSPPTSCMKVSAYSLSPLVTTSHLVVGGHTCGGGRQRDNAARISRQSGRQGGRQAP